MIESAATSQSIRLMCVDDHRLILEGIAAMVGREPDMQLVATAPSGEQALELYRQHRPDLVLMDLHLPGRGGIETIQAICRDNPRARFIVLTMLQGDEDIYRALRAGAATYLLKDALADDLVRVIREVHGGGRPLPPHVAAALASHEAHPALTPREIEVLELLAQGCRNKEISGMLGISDSTTKLHVKNILSKLNVNDRTAAVTVALRRGIIHL